MKTFFIKEIKEWKLYFYSNKWERSEPVIIFDNKMEKMLFPSRSYAVAIVLKANQDFTCLESQQMGDVRNFLLYRLFQIFFQSMQSFNLRRFSIVALGFSNFDFAAPLLFLINLLYFLYDLFSKDYFSFRL